VGKREVTMRTEVQVASAPKGIGRAEPAEAEGRSRRPRKSLHFVLKAMGNHGRF
jgi:hypothetical protein